MRTVALYAPSKTFNLAGLVGSYHIIYNPTLLDKCNRAAELSGYNNLNVLSVHALIGAYSAEDHEGLEAATLYWHATDLAWIVIFPLLYVLR